MGATNTSIIVFLYFIWWWLLYESCPELHFICTISGYRDFFQIFVFVLPMLPKRKWIFTASTFVQIIIKLHCIPSRNTLGRCMSKAFCRRAQICSLVSLAIARKITNSYIIASLPFLRQLPCKLKSFNKALIHHPYDLKGESGRLICDFENSFHAAISLALCYHLA